MSKFQVGDPVEYEDQNGVVKEATWMNGLVIYLDNGITINLIEPADIAKVKKREVEGSTMSKFQIGDPVRHVTGKRGIIDGKLGGDGWWSVKYDKPLPIHVHENQIELCDLDPDQAILDAFEASQREANPIPMRIICPECGELHVDEGEFATKPHHTHACQACGCVWRPAVVATVGVRFLPGFKNEVKGGA